MSEKISYKLDVFEGPLDLLLHLISKHKLNINDIPISELVEQYIEYVHQMQEENMDIASEFLEMAARLVYIKTVSLLPVHEEAEQLKFELAGELLEYRECQLIAKELAKNTEGFDLFSRQPQSYEPDHQYRRLHEPYEILKAYISAIGKGKRKLPPPVESFSGIIAHKIVSISSRISIVIQRLLSGKREKFISFFANASSKSEMIATFLAILELTKSKRISIVGEGEKTEVEIMNGGENS